LGGRLPIIRREGSFHALYLPIWVLHDRSRVDGNVVIPPRDGVKWVSKVSGT